MRWQELTDFLKEQSTIFELAREAQRDPQNVQKLLAEEEWLPRKAVPDSACCWNPLPATTAAAPPEPNVYLSSV